MPEVGLTSNGVKLMGWSNVSIRKSLDAICDDFSFELTNQRAGVTKKDVLNAADQLRGAEKVVIDIDGEVVLTGYIDEIGVDYDARRVSMRVSGRSKTGDLCDCAAIYSPGKDKGVAGVWKKAPFETIARDLCRPFGVLVIDSASVGGKDFERFRLEPGESVVEALQRAAELRQVVLVCNSKGNVEFVRAAETPSGASLEYGVNILSAGAQHTLRDRYSVYRFRGQTFAEDAWSGRQASQLKGEIADENVGRYRPYLVNNGKAKSSEDLGKRAVWERNTRAGRSVRYRCTVEEWTTKKAGKKAWLTNQLVHVKDPLCNIDADLLVTSVEYVLSDNERITRLELCDRTAYVQHAKAKLPKAIEPYSTPAGAVPRLFEIGAPDFERPKTAGVGTVRKP